MSGAVKATLTEGPISKTLMRMAVPMVAGLVAMMSFNLIDAYFVAGLGEHALAALSFAFPIIMIFASLSIGLGAGTSSIVAIAVGKNDQNAVKAYLTDSMSFAFIVSLILSIIGIATIEPLFKLMGASDEVLPYIKDYMFIWYINAVGLVVPMVALAAYRALGNTKMQAQLMIIGSIANAILDPILIYGWWIFPRMEIEGAALATLIIRTVSFVLVIYLLGIKDRLLINPFNLSRALDSWRKMLKVGVPAVATNIIIPASGTILISIVALHGQEAVAGFGVATRVEAVALIFFYALSGVIGPFCGQNYGAAKYARLHDAQRVCAKFCIVTGLIMAAILALIGPHIGTIFCDSSAVGTVVSTYLLIVPISYCTYGMVMVANASFNGLRHPFPGVCLSAARVVVLLFPIAWVTNQLFGLNGVFAAIAISNVLAGVWAYFWIQQTITRLSGDKVAVMG